MPNPDHHPEAVKMVNDRAGLPSDHHFGHIYIECYDKEDPKFADPYSLIRHLDWHDKLDAEPEEMKRLIAEYKDNYVAAGLNLVLGN